MSEERTVTVVVPHYDDPAVLDLVLTGLELQDHPLHLLDVVVADDGSPQPPEPGQRPYRVRVVRQADEGFRAAAARNLGAAAGTGEVLCFVDADTVPTPGYVSASLRALPPGRSLVVGRRRHADLDGVDREALRAWFTGGGPAPGEFDDPAWLREAYERTDDLRRAGDDAYRFVISAVLTVTRELFELVGGFEEGFTAYGGEDWEFAHRCWLAGADFAHAPDALAWHAGPDAAGRDDDEQRRAARNVEGLALARFVTDPAARGTGWWWDVPDVVVRLDDTGADPADVAASVASLLAGTDAGVWLRVGAVLDVLPDPRLHRGEPGADVLRRSRFQVDVAVPVVLRGATLRDLTDVAPSRVGEHLLVRRTRDLARGTEPDVLVLDGPTADPATGTDLQRDWGHDDHARRPRFSRPDGT